jgi:hypothetical protein
VAFAEQIVKGKFLESVGRREIEGREGLTPSFQIDCNDEFTRYQVFNGKVK